MKKSTFLPLSVLGLALLAAALLAAPVTASSNNNAKDVVEKPTFYKDVLPILQKDCQVCHRENGANLGGMVAPMAFSTYQDARPWAKAIAKQAQARTMPPWHASADLHGVFSNERTLDEGSIATLVNWAKAGAPAGDVADAPPARDWPSSEGWTIGEPDLVLDMGQKYFVEDDVEDQYINFETEITADMIDGPRWLKAVEFRPGSEVVHHIIARPLGGIAPGNDPTVYNDGFGVEVTPGTKIKWQMHYHKEAGPGTGVWDKSYAALKFYPADYQPEHVVQNESMGKFDFEIPPGEDYYEQKVTTTFDRDTLLLGYTPHMHLRGKYAHYLAKYPDGTEEVLLEVPRYDFNWQTHYEYPAPGKKIPAGTEVVLTMAWDNSAENPHNPDPSKTIRYGGPTTDEMMFGFISYADAEPGYTPQGGGMFGNPAQNPERMKKTLKERFGIDWDKLNEQERKELLERFSNRTESSSDSSGGR